MIARLKLYLALRKRKAIRLAQGRLVKAGISAAQAAITNMILQAEAFRA